MKVLFRIVPGFILFCCLAVMLEPRALAYIDPGSGLLITQTIGAVATAVVFWFRRQIRSLFVRGRSSGEKSEP